VGRLFIHWLYFQQLDILDHVNWEPKDEIDRDLALPRLYILADKLLIPRLQNSIIQIMHQHVQENKLLLINTLEYVYDNTSSGSLLRRFILHLCACYMPPERYSELSEKVPKEMLFELAAAYATKFQVEDAEKAFGMGTNWSQYKVVEK